MKFEIRTFWADDCTFPDPLDTGIEVEVKDIDEAIKIAMDDIKPQVKPYIEKEIFDETYATLTYYPTPSKNKTDYCETVEIRAIED